MEIYWTSRKTINGLKHFVLINQYEFKKKVYLDFVSALDEAISFTISKKVFERSSQWIKGWNNNESLSIEVEGKRYSLLHEKLPIHDPTSVILRS